MKLLQKYSQVWCKDPYKEWHIGQYRLGFYGIFSIEKRACTLSEDDGNVALRNCNQEHSDYDHDEWRGSL